MKTTRYLYMALCLSAISAVSCTKESNGDSPVSYEKCSIQAVAEQTTKTHISDLTAGTVAWNSGDALSVFSADKAPHANNSFTSSDLSGSTAKFSGQIESLTTSLYALYPYTEGATYSDGIISGAVIPTEQTATDNSFGNGVSLALAHGTREPGGDVEQMDFTNLCAILAFDLPENITFANKITVTPKSGANMAGSVTINCSTKAITSASASSVVLSGTFTGGNKYMVSVAPGTYTDGFTFLIETEGGNSYSRSTSRTATLEAGKIYTLGKLSLEIPAECFSPKVVVTHNVSNNTLNGSTAVFSMTSNVPDEFDGAIKSVLTTVSVTKGSNSIRTCAAAGKNVGNTTMTQSAGCPYVPSGCTYSAIIVYTINNGVKDVAHQVVKDCEVVWSAPSGFAIEANLSGHTSYDTYTTSGASAANEENGSTIYGIGATYKSGLSTDVYTQCSSLLSITSTLDGTAASGDQGSQSWAAHTIGAKWSFEGAEGTCSSTKKVSVTGLPVKITSANLDNLKNNGWSTQGTVQTFDNYLCTFKHTWGGTDKGAMVTPKFYLPAQTNVSCYVKHMNYASGVGKNQKAYIGPVSTTSSTTTAYSLTCAYTSGSTTHDGTLSFALSSSSPYIYFGVEGTYNTTPTHTTYYLIDIKIQYN